MAYVIAVQQVGVLFQHVELFLNGVGDGRFAGATETGEPEYTGFLFFQGGAVFFGDRGGVPDNILASHLWSFVLETRNQRAAGIEILTEQKVLELLSH